MKSFTVHSKDEKLEKPLKIIYDIYETGGRKMVC